ncbi:methyltransferase domain-containing protein [Streptomyces avermitilis]|uniref:class I SAM-dependent methyltransferase n=1 Tax=Streptomyces avermitilis TaxID=33903 RepID=UPI0033C50F48
MMDHDGVIRRHELTDQERELLAPLIPRAATGRPRVEDRQVINGMVYKIRTGISWREPSAEVTATDLNEAMVAFGSIRASGAVWRQADAQRLPFPDGGFDLVVCQFGVMFFPDRIEAFTEVRRVLARDGRFLFNTWGSLGTHAFEVALQAGLERAFPVDPPRFFQTGPHGYSDPAVVAADLAAAGFAVEDEQELTLQGRAASTADLATGYLTGTPVRAAVEERGDGPAVRATVIEEMTARLGPGPVTAPMTAYVFRAAA